MQKFPLRLLSFTIFLWLCTAAFGAETGTLRGTVRDASNQAPLEGVEVTIEGSGLPGGRAQTTNSRGNYWFPVLPPGGYRITFLKDGYQTKAFDATVLLDQTTTLPPADLNLLTYSAEAIEIVATAPVIDNTQSAIGENLEEDYLDRLPIGRSLTAVFDTLPGVTATDYSSGGPSSANPSVRGEGAYGNNYLLEGFSTRDPVSKTMGLALPFDALQEVNVFTDGAPAEFGDFTGMIANVLLKSGQNETHGSISYNFSHHLSTGTYEILDEERTKRRFLYHTPVITLGGPIVPDKLWYFGVLDYRTGWGQPEGTDVVTNLDYNYMFLTRLTYSPIEDGNTLLNLTIQKQGTQVDNAGAGVNTAPEATVKGINDVLYLNANLKTVLSPYIVLEAKWNKSNTQYHEESKAESLLTPSYRDAVTGEISGNAAYLYSSLRERQGIAVHLTRFVTELAGQHMFKGGYEFHQFGDNEDFTYTGGVGTEDSPAYEYVLADGEPTWRIEHYNVGPIAHNGTNNVFFLQDQWQPATNLTLNIGVRADGEVLLQNSSQKTVSQWGVAPRFGLAWDVTRDSINLVTANAGRYYDVNGLGFVQWADTQTANYFTVCRIDPDTNEYNVGCFTQDPIADPSVYQNTLRPYYMDKFTLGVTRAVTPLMAVGLKGILSTTRDLPEDIDIDGHKWEIVNPDIKRRDYWGVELTAQRRFADNWQVMGSLTYSSSKGTSPGSFETGSDENSGGNGNEVGVFLDDIADPYVRVANDYFMTDFAGMGYASYEAFGQEFAGNTAGWYGYLPYHSFVKAQLHGSYQFNFGTELGVSYTFDSGHAWQRRGVDLYGGHGIFPEGRGARFTSPLHSLDLRIAQKFDLPKKISLLAELTIFNVLDLKTPIAYYENFDQTEQWEVDEDGRYYYTSVNAEGEEEKVYSMFGQVFARQPPRSVQANVKVTF